MESINTKSSAWQILIRQMTVEVHRTMEDPNDLKSLPFDGEEDDVLLVAGRAAAFCPESSRNRQDSGLDWISPSFPQRPFK
jgi:hypothetical protein